MSTEDVRDTWGYWDGRPNEPEEVMSFNTVENARVALRRRLHEETGDDPQLRPAFENQICKLLTEVYEETKRDVEREQETKLRQIFQLIGSARIRLENLSALKQLQQYARDALASNFPAHEWDQINNAKTDLEKAKGLDDEIPF